MRMSSSVPVSIMSLAAVALLFAQTVVAQTQLPSPSPNDAPTFNSLAPSLSADRTVLYYVSQVASGGPTSIVYSTVSGGPEGIYGPRTTVPNLNSVGTDKDSPSVLPDNSGIVFITSNSLFRMHIALANTSAADPSSGFSTPVPLDIGGGTDFGPCVLRRPGLEGLGDLFFSSTRWTGSHEIGFAPHDGILGYSAGSWNNPVNLGIAARTPGAALAIEPSVVVLPDGRVEMIYAALVGGEIRLWRTTNPSAESASLGNPSAWTTPEPLPGTDVGSSTRAPYVDPVDHTLYLEGTVGANRLLFVADLQYPSGGRPIANAGVDQSVYEGDIVSLDGSGTIYLGDGEIVYLWTQIGGTPALLDGNDLVHPQFVAPQVPLGGQVLSFELIVSDGVGQPGVDTIDVVVSNVNNVPVAQAGVDQEVLEGSTVVLDGSDSFDVDADPLTFTWSQISGPVVQVLASSGGPIFSFIAPTVSLGDIVLGFELVVDDGQESSLPSQVEIIVSHANQPPIAQVGPSLVRNEGSPVQLDASASSDPEGDPLSFQWTQSTGIAVALSDPHSPTPTFTAPTLANGNVTLSFLLTVSDGLHDTSALLLVQILDHNAPPNCTLAMPSRHELWPPNHKLVSVSIDGVGDPDGDGFDISITGVTQDEPTLGLGSGDTPIDAVIRGSTVMLRSERDGSGDGRVYRISFTATDTLGQTCSGVVRVAVPKSKGNQHGAIEGTAVFNSTL